MLLLASHTVESATAKVPFSMIILLDHIKRKAIPEQFKLRMTIPSGGLHSFSLWEAEDADSLLQWLVQNLGDECQTEVTEVQEEFTYGLSVELARQRAGERVSNSSKQTLNALGQRSAKAAEYVAAATARTVETAQVGLGNLDKRTGVLTAAKEGTSAAMERMSTVVEKAMENQRVANVVGNVQAGVSTSWKRMGESLGWMGSKLDQAVQNVVREREQDGGMQVYMDYDSVPTAIPASHPGTTLGAEEDTLAPLDEHEEVPPPPPGVPTSSHILT